MIVPPTLDADGLAAGIGAVLSAATGAEVVVAGLHRLTGGASRETWAARTESGTAGERTVVLRRDPPGHGQPERMRAEAACLRAAAAAGVPVPTLIAAGDDAPGIHAPFLVTELVPGEAIARKLQRDPEFADARTHLAEDMGRVLGMIHRTGTESLTMLDRYDPLEQIETMYLRFDEPRPAVELGLRWLREHRPDHRPDALVHGDFRMGNILVDPSGIRGVLDWELAHLGDPIEDLGWLCVRAWRFGSPAPVAGVGTREQLLDGYAETTGYRPSTEELRWWEVFGTLRWLIISRFQAQRHLGGEEHSLELAAIGRRVCESEYDLLLVLDLLDTTAIGSIGPTEPSTLHDRPQLTEILDLVTDTLRSDVLDALAPDRARERYQLRICLNLLGTAAREIAAGGEAEATVAAALNGAGHESEAELAARIRDGSVDYTEPLARRAISAAVVGRLRVANPRHELTGKSEGLKV